MITATDLRAPEKSHTLCGTRLPAGWVHTSAPAEPPRWSERPLAHGNREN
ncbi:hypothetical protein Ntsu_33200 [Nocardia sp. IFM 10818]